MNCQFSKKLRSWRDGSHNLAVAADPVLSGKAALIYLASYSDKNPKDIKLENIVEIIRSLRIQSSATTKKSPFEPIDAYRNLIRSTGLLHEALSVLPAQLIPQMGLLLKEEQVLKSVMDQALRMASLPIDIKWTFGFPITRGWAASNGMYYEFSWVDGSLKENGIKVEKHVEIPSHARFVYSLLGSTKIQFKETSYGLIGRDKKGGEIILHNLGGRHPSCPSFNGQPYLYIRPGELPRPPLWPMLFPQRMLDKLSFWISKDGPEEIIFLDNASQKIVGKVDAMGQFFFPGRLFRPQR